MLPPQPWRNSSPIKVRAGSHILSDGWRGYRSLKQKGI
jgi:hypothetical protein